MLQLGQMIGSVGSQSCTKHQLALLVDEASVLQKMRIDIICYILHL